MLTKVQDLIFTHAYAADAAVKSQSLDFFNLFNFGKPKAGATAEGIFSTLIGKIMGWVLVIVAVIAFIYLIINGIKYITAGGDAAKATEARNGIVNAIIGVVIVLLAYVILRFAGSLGTELGKGI